MSHSNSVTHFLIYFVDPAFCILFGLTLAFAQARFIPEQTAPLQLVRVAKSSDAHGAAVDALEVGVRTQSDSAEILFEGQVLDISQFEERIQKDPPPVLTLRPEGSQLAEIIAIAHAAGVTRIRVAYEVGTKRGDTP